jgi:hypothetical protein
VSRFALYQLIAGAAGSVGSALITFLVLWTQRR